MDEFRENTLVPLLHPITEGMKEIQQIGDKTDNNKNIQVIKSEKSKIKVNSNPDDDSESPPPAKKQKLFLPQQQQPSKSPKKRLNLPEKKPECKQFIYGNYSRYYGYRNLNDFKDIRLDIFAQQKDLFNEKEILDIGCNCGLITMEIARNFNIKHITGLDIDKSLINKATKYIHKMKRTFVGDNKAGFPFNVNFIYGNYVVIDDVLLEIEREQFDLILCLSVTKWIHLNFGDSGLKRAFRRMFLQLKPGGKLILEAQPWSGYKRRKKLTPNIFDNYKAIKFFPKDFTNYLLGPEVGFSEVYDLGVPSHSSEGFRRPIQVFVKQSKKESDKITQLATEVT